MTMVSGLRKSAGVQLGNLHWVPLADGVLGAGGVGAAFEKLPGSLLIMVSVQFLLGPRRVSVALFTM